MPEPRNALEAAAMRYEMTGAVPLPDGIAEIGHQGPDVVILAHGGQRRITLGPDVRDEFQKLYMEAETQAEAWAAEHPAVSDG
jgi:hypothetical protein